MLKAGRAAHVWRSFVLLESDNGSQTSIMTRNVSKETGHNSHICDCDKPGAVFWCAVCGSKVCGLCGGRIVKVVEAAGDKDASGEGK